MRAIPLEARPFKSAFDAEITEDNLDYVLREMGKRGIMIDLSYSVWTKWCCKLRKTINVRGSEVHINGSSFGQENPCKAVDDAMKYIIKRYRDAYKFEPEGYPELIILK